MPATPADGRRPLPWPVAGLVTVGVIVWLALALTSVLIVPGLLHPLLPASELQRLTLDQQVQRQQEQRKLQNEARAALIQGLVGLLALSGAAIGASVAWRQLQDNRRHQQHNEKLSQDQLELSREQLRQALDTSREQLRLTQEELRLSREGQVTERFTRAIDQLGNDKGQLNVVLGGIYGLERIARDSSYYRPIIAEVLAAYVRTHAPRRPIRADQHKAEDSLNQLSTLQWRVPNVQAALAVLGGRTFGIELDLRGTDLRKADLKGAKFKGVRLYDAALQLARLQGADLQGARLDRAILQGARLDDANLQGARLDDANLQGARLQGADLQGARLDGANFQEAQFDRATLRGALADGTTKWPDGFDASAAGVLLSEGANTDRPP